MTAESQPHQPAEFRPRPRAERKSAWMQVPAIVRFESYLQTHRVSGGNAQLICRRVMAISNVDGIEPLAYCDIDQFIAQHFGGKSAQYQPKLRSALGKFQTFIWSEAA